MASGLLSTRYRDYTEFIHRFFSGCADCEQVTEEMFGDLERAFVVWCENDYVRSFFMRAATWMCRNVDVYGVV